jgi:hypothetical protein
MGLGLSFILRFLEFGDGEVSSYVYTEGAARGTHYGFQHPNLL